MANLRIMVQRMAPLVIGLLLSSGAIADPAPVKVVILRCLSNPIITVIACDKSTGVETACPALETSCAQAVTLFESAPDNLKIISVAPSPVAGFWYTLGTKKGRLESHRGPFYEDHIRIREQSWHAYDRPAWRLPNQGGGIGPL